MNDDTPAAVVTEKLASRTSLHKKLTELGYAYKTSLVETKSESYGLFLAPIGFKVCIRVQGVSTASRTLSKLSDEEIPTPAHNYPTITVGESQATIRDVDDVVTYQCKTAEGPTVIYPLISSVVIFENPWTALEQLDRICVFEANAQALALQQQHLDNLGRLKKQYQNQCDLVQQIGHRAKMEKESMATLKAALQQLLKDGDKIDQKALVDLREQLAMQNTSFQQLLSNEIA
jgi:hypothetical protein